MATWGNQDALASQPIFVSREAHFDSTAVNTTAHTINLLTANTDFATGTAVHYSINGGTVIGGLTDGTTYYVNRVDANNIALYDTQAHAIAGGATGLLSISGAGVGTQILKIDGSIANPGYDHNYNGRSTFIVDEQEAQATENRAIGLKTPGWVTYTTYTAADGSVRHKSEVLVAFGGELTAAVDNANPSNDPIVSGDITIGTQPVNASVTHPATATFTVAATITGPGTIGYQWYRQANGSGSFSAISGATSASYTTPATTVLANNGDVYHCVLSATDYTTVTSANATLTVA